MVQASPGFSYINVATKAGRYPPAFSMTGRCISHTPPPVLLCLPLIGRGLRLQRRYRRGAVCSPHAAPIPVHLLPVGGILFFLQRYCQRGVVYDPPIPLSLRFPPFFSFCTGIINEGAAYDLHAVPSCLYPQKLGVFFARGAI